MTKNEFLAELKDSLSGLPEEDVKERLEFFGEMIDDSMDEGLSEEQAVAKIGSVDSVVSQILEDTPLSRLVKQKIKPKRRMAAWEIVLLAAGSPLWIVLLAAALVVVLSVYIVIWSVAISIWSVFAAFAACAAALAAVAPGFMIAGRTLEGVIFIAATLVLAGLSIFAFYGAKKATDGTVWLTKKTALAIKKPFCRKENRQ